MKPVGEPDARNEHVRFDERRVETGHGSDREAPATERVGTRYAEPKPPRHTSTLPSGLGGWAGGIFSPVLPLPPLYPLPPLTPLAVAGFPLSPLPPLYPLPPSPAPPPLPPLPPLPPFNPLLPFEAI